MTKSYAAGISTALNTTLVVGKQSIAVEIVVDPDVQSLPVVLTWAVLHPNADIHQEEEFYADVPTALARIAVISACSDANWWTKVRDNSTEFTRRTHEFFADSLTA